MRLVPTSSLSTRLAVAAGLACLLALAAPLPAYATASRDGTDTVVQRGGGVTVTIDGRGFGHGKGLSQYGALGRAQAGHSHRRIVNFYYPGTTWAKAGGRIRVLVTADTSRDVVVLDRTRLTVRALGSGKRWQPSVEADRWRIVPTSDGRSVVSYLDGTWREWKRFAGDAEFSAAGRPLTLVTPSGEARYRGALRSASTSSGTDGAGEDQRDTVNVLALDAYLRGVVPREVPALWPEAAVRAQSVAARTYAAFERAAVGTRHFDVWDDTRSQVYGGVGAEHYASDAAVRATARQVLHHEGRPAFTQFSASNGGWTVQGTVHGEGVPYLVAKQDRKDGYPSWSETFTGREVTRHWPGLGTLRALNVLSRDGNGRWGGRVVKIRVVGSEGSVPVSGDTFRSLLGLRSTLFNPSVG